MTATWQREFPEWAQHNLSPMYDGSLRQLLGHITMVEEVLEPGVTRGQESPPAYETERDLLYLALLRLERLAARLEKKAAQQSPE